MPGKTGARTFKEAQSGLDHAPLVLVWGPDNEDLTIGLTRYLASTGALQKPLTKRDFLRGSAHPVFLDCLPFSTGNKTRTWHQTSAFFVLAHHPQLRSELSHLPHDTALWAAFRAASLFILTTGSLNDLDRSVLKTAAFLGVRQVLLVGKMESATENFLKNENFSVTARLTDGFQAKGDNAAFWKSLMSALDQINLSKEAVADKPFLFLANRCSDIGFMKGVAIKGVPRPGMPLTVTRHGQRVKARIVTVNDIGFFINWVPPIESSPSWDGTLVSAVYSDDATPEDAQRLTEMAGNSGLLKGE